MPQNANLVNQVIQRLANKVAQLEVTVAMLEADRDAWKARAEAAEGEMRGGAVEDGDAVATEVPDPGA